MRGSFIISILVAAVLSACNGSKNSVPIDEEVVNDLVNIEYGIVTDSFIVVKDQVQKNQNLASILLPYGVPYTTIDQLAKASKQVFDVRKLAVGQPYTIFCKKDSSGMATCFVYEASALEYVVFDMRDTLHIYKEQKPVEKRQIYVSGTVNASLYVDLKRLNADPMLAIELSEIYAWTIDFYRIQKGDAFEVLYTENFVEGTSVGIDRIDACTFSQFGKPIHAYYFENGNEKGYFDQEGNNLKKAFLKAPVKFSRISSGYNKNRLHPVLNKVRPHLGTDYAAPKGTPIMSVGDGTVIEAQYKANNGNYVKIKHNGTYSTQYLHMSKIRDGIRVGKRVSQGEVIGYVGSTGLATGPHVCFRFWKNGKQVDHRREELPASIPISDGSKTAFSQLVAKRDSVMAVHRGLL